MQREREKLSLGGEESAPRFLGEWVGAQVSRGAQGRGPGSPAEAVLGRGQVRTRELTVTSPAFSRAFGLQRERR